ncbi:MAG TPA: alpha/beta fold hydrolase, partial [Gemmatimonadaceae bacterium]|nr:alpha/beta fold hydrolase [Gemmatimonadaceae bacterium]
GGGAGGGAGTAGGGRGGRGGRGGGGGFSGAMDSTRARQLYVSNRKEDFGSANYESQRIAKQRIDSTYEAKSRGVMGYRKTSYKSTWDGMEIPVYVYTPLTLRGPRGHAAMVWVHGGVHGTWDADPYFPFVREAVQRGYVIVAPDYRGSTGYGKAMYDAFDYGGKEVDDVMSAFEFLKTLPFVDTARIGIMGWSHGGFITAHSLFRDVQPFKAGAAIVPVTNLFVRLARSGPGYQRDFAASIGAMTHENTAEYIARSPVYQADKLKVPILVHVATNDCDVYFIENQQMVYTLRALKPDLAETKIYVDPPPGGAGCGHTFSRRVNPQTLERDDSPEQIDSWNRTWAFFEWSLRPNFDPSKK